MKIFNYKTNPKQNIIPAAIILLGIILSFLFLGPDKSRSQNMPENSQKQKIDTITVKVQKVADSQKISQTLEFPALVAGDQEITVVAKSTGSIKRLNFDLGSKVREGSVLASIDDTGNELSEGKNNFQSIQIQQAELAVKQAKKNLDLAKKNDKNCSK